MPIRPSPEDRGLLLLRIAPREEDDICGRAECAEDNHDGVSCRASDFRCAERRRPIAGRRMTGRVHHSPGVCDHCVAEGAGTGRHGTVGVGGG